MLLLHIEPKPKYKFLVDWRDGRRILVPVGRATIDAPGGTPLWHREAGDEDSLGTMRQWTGARCEGGTELGELADKVGAEASAPCKTS